MKKLLLLAVVIVTVGLCGSAALALDPIGPTTGGLNQGQWSVGAEWSHSRMNFNWPTEVEKRIWRGKTNKYYANVAYGITDEWAGFVRMGAGDLVYKRGGGAPEVWSWHGEDSGPDGFGIGAGIRKTIWEQSPDFVWGALVQYSWMNFQGQRKRMSGMSAGEGGTFHTELTELQIAVGPNWTPREGIVVYGGPFLHFVGGHHATRTPYSNSHPLEERGCVGGFVGGQIEITQSCCLNLEYMDTGDCNAFAMALIHRR